VHLTDAGTVDPPNAPDPDRWSSPAGAT